MATRSARGVVANVATYSAALSSSVNAVLPPLLPHDSCESLLLLLQGDTAESPLLARTCTVEVYLHTSQPDNTTANIRNGRLVLNLLIPLDTKQVLSGTALPYLRQSIPMYIRAGQQSRYLAVIITHSAAGVLSGSCVLSVSRQLEVNP